MNGHCLNTTIPQNVTFGYQGLPGGKNAGSGNGTGNGGPNQKSGAARIVGAGLWATTTVALGLAALML